MKPLLRLAPFALLAAGASVSPVSVAGQTPSAVQPGAPGQPNKTLSSDQLKPATRPPSQADIDFMQGMIMHHNQAVVMTDLLKTRAESPEVRNMGSRIHISQTDEMRFMKQWLADRGLPEGSMDMGGMSGMAGMDHSQMAGMDHSQMAGMDHSQMAGMDHPVSASPAAKAGTAPATDPMDAMPPMPGMLTPRQMEALRAAHGPTFDHLFLTGMIQHHTGALTMVKQLFANPGAGQDPVLFDFASDVDNTQTAEIDIMKGILQKEKQ